VGVQVGLSSSDLRLRVLTDLVEQVVSEALYDTLRTKQQLGYTVSSGARLTHGVTGFCVVVVSAAFDAATVEQRIEAFMLEFQQMRLKVGTGVILTDWFDREKQTTYCICMLLLKLVILRAYACACARLLC
jgi:hypothetical protein